jgi:hypothetical protein
MTGRQEYDRTKDRQRILGKYMIDKSHTTNRWFSVFHGGDPDVENLINLIKRGQRNIMTFMDLSLFYKL